MINFSQIERLLGKAFYPIRGNFAFFVFMFLLGYACTMLEVPHVRGAKPYSLAPIELFFDLYIVCIILSIIPHKIRRWIKAAMYTVIYPTSIIDIYCFVKFGSTLTPTMLLLVGETNSSEASEFLSAYLDWSLLTTPIGWILLIMLVHIACNIFANESHKNPGIRRKLTGKMGRLYSKLSPTDKAKVSIGAAAGGILGALSILLFINGYQQTFNNKKATVRLMSYKNIGDVEHELTKKDRANLYLPIYRLAFSIYANELAAKQIDQLVDAIGDIKVDSCSYRSRNIVFVIGESYNKHHSQLYGYNHPTTPRQVEMAQSGQLIPFDDVIAPWNLTSFVFKNIFSMHAVGDKGEWCDYPLFPELFRKAGYKVTFITNQFLPQAKEAVYDFSGGFFLNNPKLSAAQFDVRNKILYRYDGGLLVDYDRIKREEQEKEEADEKAGRPKSNNSIAGECNLTILHLKGQHVSYFDRYPQSRKKFTSDDYPEWEQLDHQSKMRLADYDNATLYNDSIMREIVRRFEDDDAIIVYMSDHGEEAYGDGMKIFGRNHSAAVDFRLAHEEFEIPFWIWCSKKYIRNHPHVFKRIKEAHHRPFMTDNVAQTLLYLAGIHCPQYRSDYNILSDDFNADRPRIIKNKADYNKLKAEHEREQQERTAK